MEQVTIKDAGKMSKDSLFQKLNTSAKGLSAEEAKKRLEETGPNALPEKHVSMLVRFFSYFWGPIPWMIEIAAVLSLAVKHLTDFFVIFALLLFNAGIGFWQELKASNALDALKAQLALKARVLRDGKWIEIEAREIVPGDMVRIKIGDIIPEINRG